MLYVIIGNFLQVLHNISMWTAKEKSINYDQAKADAAKAQKDIKMVNNRSHHDLINNNNQRNKRLTNINTGCWI